MMLLHCPRQQDHHTLSTHYQPFDTSSSFHPRTLNPALSTLQSPPHRPSHHSPHSMQTSQKQSNPTVRIHQSTPSPSHGIQSHGNQLMLGQDAFLPNDWANEGLAGAGYLDPVPTKPRGYHKRLSSASTVTSAGGPPSPHDHTSPFCQIATNSDSSHYSPLDNFDCVSTPPPAQQQQNNISKSLPTPVATPTSTTFMPAGYKNAPLRENIRYPASAMLRMHSATADDDASSFAFTAPHSASSMTHNSPATPLTNYEAESDEQNFSPAYDQSAAFSQSMQDVFADQLFGTPASQPFARQPQSNMLHTSSHLSPYHNMNVFPNRLQAANQDQVARRTNSPVMTVARERSPFRSYNMQELGNDAAPRNQMAGMRQAMVGLSQASSVPKSVSPKELLLEEPDEADTTPLFPPRFDQASAFGDGREDTDMSAFGDQDCMYSRKPFSAAMPQLPQQYPFVSNRRRQPQSSTQGNDRDQVPDFPARIVSMETTVEEGTSEPSSSQKSGQPPSQPIQRPVDTSSDSGTYSCTYGGCTLRFETPTKLQRHKREAHRQASPGARPTSALASPTNFGLRNSQAGPHKCERVNPSTGKVCNSIFSRPYDLTRHEHTVHDRSKERVVCDVCPGQEKTFSRHDALSRHMKVVHPDVYWPGKTRKGKGRE